VRIDVLTIFPDYLAPLDLSLVGKARRDGVLAVEVHDLRDWATDRHRTVDDTPAGGGAGMVMRPDVWGRALDDVLGARPGSAQEGEAPAARPTSVLLLPTPAGRLLTQGLVEELAREVEAGSRLVIACGRYEGIDARVGEHYAAAGRARVLEVSIGDYVLGGGEVAALVVVEAVARLLPGVIGNPDSLVEESHGASGLLDGPVYTRPLAWRGLDVPDVLRSGHHERIRRWRRDRALERTARRRPDLLERLDPRSLDRLDRRLLAELGWLPEGSRLVRAPAPEGEADVAPSA
jgi:tRNA (guanine37-N1)-methyltransferase